MECPVCYEEMEKGYMHANSKDKVSLAKNWHCTNCGHREPSSQYNIEKE